MERRPGAQLGRQTVGETARIGNRGSSWRQTGGREGEKKGERDWGRGPHRIQKSNPLALVGCILCHWAQEEKATGERRQKIFQALIRCNQVDRTNLGGPQSQKTPEREATAIVGKTQSFLYWHQVYISQTVLVRGGNGDLNRNSGVFLGFGWERTTPGDRPRRRPARINNLLCEGGRSKDPL